MENWRKILEEDAETMVEEAREWLKDNPDEDLLARFEEDEDEEPFYLHETLDNWGYFIYLDNESVKDAMDCLSQLEEWEETDSGLWDRLNDYREELNARAFWTYKNALRDKVREKLQELKEKGDI